MRDRNCWILLHREQVGSTGSSMETRVTLRLGEKSAKALVAEHGHRLVCVRYRYDAAAQVRCKTMEHVVDNSPGARARMPPIQRADRLRRWGCVSHTRIVRYGSEFVSWADGGVRALRRWVLPLRTAKRLELQDRKVPVPDGVETGPEVYHRKLGEKPDGKPREKPTAINQVGSGGLSWGLLLVRRHGKRS